MQVRITHSTKSVILICRRHFTGKHFNHCYESNFKWILCVNDKGTMLLWMFIRLFFFIFSCLIFFFLLMAFDCLCQIIKWYLFNYLLTLIWWSHTHSVVNYIVMLLFLTFLSLVWACNSKHAKIKFKYDLQVYLMTVGTRDDILKSILYTLWCWNVVCKYETFVNRFNLRRLILLKDCNLLQRLTRQKARWAAVHVTLSLR